MGRSTSLLIMAFALGATAPKPNSSNHNPDTKTPTEKQEPKEAQAPPQEAVESQDYKHPCRNTPDDRKSDLCAQWQAADAARDSAMWTMFGVVVAIAGAAGLFIQVYLTRKALDVAMDDRRPSIYADAVTYKLANGIVKAEIGIKNFGLSEALGVAFTAAVSVGPYPLPNDPPPLRPELRKPSGKLHPGQSRWQYVDKDVTNELVAIADETRSLIVSGYVTYFDRFGRQYADRFDYFCTGKDFQLRALRVCDPWTKPEEPNENMDAK